MPKIATYKFLTFFIYSFDALNEPPHLHVVKEKGSRQRSAKIWLHSLKFSDQGNRNVFGRIHQRVRLFHLARLGVQDKFTRFHQSV